MSIRYFHVNKLPMGRPPGIRFHVTVAMRLEKELAEALEKVAKEEERPMGSMARIILREGLEAREAKGPRKKVRKSSQED